MTGTSSRHAGICSSGVVPRRRARTVGRVTGGVVGSTMGAMCEPSPSPVTPSLSGRRLFDRGGLLLRQRTIGTTTPDRLGVDPRTGAGVQAREGPGLPVGGEACRGRALLCAGV